MTTIYTYNGQVLTEASTGKWLIEKEVPIDPLNPLNLPTNTVRVRTNDGQPPVRGEYSSYETATLVTGTSDVYDVYKSGTDFIATLYGATNVIEVLGANTTGITRMRSLLYECTALTSVALFNTSSVTDMMYMFFNCSSLTSIPLFNTSSVTMMDAAFYECRKVESGALALYQQVSSQANPPSTHTYVFYNCGIDTTTGAAELAQIPSDWK